MTDLHEVTEKIVASIPEAADYGITHIELKGGEPFFEDFVIESEKPVEVDSVLYDDLLWQAFEHKAWH